MLGAYDPLPAIADVCTKYNLWLHVDAAWGGAVMFSKRHRYLIKGIERYRLYLTFVVAAYFYSKCFHLSR